MNKLCCLLCLIVGMSCSDRPSTEKFLPKRNNIVDVKDKIKEIMIEEIEISSFATIYPINDYLIITDYHAPGELIHLFDKKSFRYIISTTFRGQGPGEIANLGCVGVDNASRRFFVSDHGKNAIFCYELDSVLTNPEYIPQEKIKMVMTQFPDRYRYINDTLSIGRIIEPTGYYGFNQVIGRWNMLTGEIRKMPYTHPEIERKSSLIAVSVEHDIYVEVYCHHDLMTICSLDGTLLHNVYYTPDWDNRTSNAIDYYGFVEISNDRIFATHTKNDHGNGVYPTNILVYDLEGNYIKTLKTDRQIINFCIDQENQRLIMNMNDEMQFGYLDLTEI